MSGAAPKGAGCVCTPRTSRVLDVCVADGYTRHSAGGWGKAILWSWLGSPGMPGRHTDEPR